MFDAFFLPDIPPWLFWTCNALSVLVQGISKSGFAGGLGILSLPLMMLVMPVDIVAATLLPLLILCDANAVYHHRRTPAWDKVWAVYLPSIAGIAAGAALWWWIGQAGVEQYSAALKRFVGVIAILFGIYIAVRERAANWVARFQPGRGAAWTAGASAGFCSTVAHAAGPIVALYLFTQNLGKTRFVGTVAWTFAFINLTKFPFYIAVGLITGPVLLFALVLLPLIPLGSWIGWNLHGRVSERGFNRILCVLVVLAGVQLLTGYNPVYDLLAAAK